ncbi:MAG: UDP-N-acetylmuramoyl-tripeptide--D-alanyl-D-alanine ligase [Sedimentisphaerales bacterium]|nr:UDP-N-acetylmuramoyl-tripeptide--D-alanyl-D-alanine ligase [Sedimentisphaerales bacterium]
MKEFSITSLMRIIGAEVLPQTGWAAESAGDNAVVTGVSIDSRTVKPGDCFFAIKGEKFDGHDYVADAFAKGAVCAVIGKTVGGETLAGKCLLRVADTVRALGDFAAEYRRQAGFKVVAITGSAGKTTTRQITAHALSRRFRVHQSPNSFNNSIGVPLTLLGADPRDEIVVGELGSNHPGEIANLTRITQPDIAVVTNVHPAHLEGFGNLEAIAREKTSISEGLGPDGVLIINGDFEQLVDACRAKGVDVLAFGKSDGLDYRATDITSDGLSSRFMIDQTEVTLPLAGPGNVENTLAAWAVCSQLGLKIKEFAEAVRTLPPISMRAEVLQIGAITVLNDCYNANPASMNNALDILQSLQANTGRRSVFICGDMAELGADAESLHRRLGESISRANVELLIAVGEFAEVTAGAARKSANRDLHVKCFKDARSAGNNLHEFVKEYDIVLVKGSRCARLETAVEKLKELCA